MLTKFAKAILYSVIAGIIFTVTYVGYFYFEGFLVTRSALNSIANIVANENCVASEEIYLSEDGRLYSMQEKVKGILDDYDNSRWYLDIETSGADWFGPNKTLNVTYNTPLGASVVANSYVNAAPRGTVLHLELKTTVKMHLRFVPNHDDPDGFLLELPLKCQSQIVGLKYYKSTEDNRLGY